jgi:AraC family transcriptional activator of pobA
MSKVSILDIHEFGRKEELVDFYCNDFKDHLETHHKIITDPHKHNLFLTVLFTHGSGIHEIDFEKYTVKPGSIFMLNPGQIHYWELSNDIGGIILLHSQEFFDISFTKQSIYDFPFFSFIHNQSALFLNETEENDVARSFELVLKEYKEPQALSKQKIIALLSGIYIDLTRIYLNTGNKDVSKHERYTEYLHTLEKLIEENFKTEKSPATYAEMLNITIRHLNRLTQSTLGKSTTQLITERVILEAKRLIVYNPTSLAKISYDLGYKDYSYFSRLFKKWTEFTPSEFSKSYEF